MNADRTDNFKSKILEDRGMEEAEERKIKRAWISFHPGRNKQERDLKVRNGLNR
jgi:hypothetical protein